MSLALHYDFTTPSLAALIGPTLDITRATKATMVDADGWIREVQAGEARFPGASFAANNILQSQTFDTSWINIRSSEAVSAEVDPDGGANAWVISDDSSNNTHGMRQVFTYKAGRIYIMSVYAKPVNVPELAIDIDDSAGTNRSSYFDITTGVVGTLASNTLASGIEDAGNGWYRCWVVIQPPAGTDNITIHPCEAGEDRSYQGLSQEATLLYGAQLDDVTGAWDSQNLLLQSNQFDTTWSNFQSSEDQSGPYADPFGGTDAWRLVDDSAGGTGAAQISNASVDFVNPGTYIASGYFKADQLDWAYFSLDSLSGPNPFLWVDLTNGVIGATGASNKSEGIIDIGSGWYRVWIEFEVQSTDTAGRMLLRVAEGNSDAVIDRDGTSSILMYGMQVEPKKPNQTAPGTYTETTTAAVTNYSPSAYIPTTAAAASSLSGTSDGLLVEEARTNICLQSEDFSTTWSAAQATISTDQTTAPDGSLSADIIAEDGTAAQTHRVTQTVSGATVGTNAFSVFVKANLRTWVRLRDNTSTNTPNVYFDLANGVVGTENGGATGTIEDYGNGWYRCTMVSDVTANTIEFGIFIAEADNDAVFNGLSQDSLFIWGAQLEAGAFPTSYIPTTTASVTRNADDLGSTDVSWYSQGNPSSFYARGTNRWANAEGWMMSVRSGLTNLINIGAYNPGTGAAVEAKVLGGQSGISVSAGQFPSNSARQIAARVDIDDVKLYCNGNAAATDTTYSAIGSGFNSLDVGNEAGGRWWNGVIAELRYYDEAFTDQQLEDMSNGIFPSFDVGNNRRTTVMHRMRMARG